MADSLDVRTNWQKFILLLASLVVMTVLVLFNEVEWEAVATPFGIIVGYGAANGIGAYKGTAPAPLFVPRNPQRRIGDSGPIKVVPVDPSGAVEVELPETLTPEQHRAAERARRRAEREG